MNSDPIRLAASPLSATRTTAAATTATRKRNANASAGAYTRLMARMTAFSCSATRPVTNSARAAGTKVSDSNIAATSAMTTVNAMG